MILVLNTYYFINVKKKVGTETMKTLLTIVSALMLLSACVSSKNDQSISYSSDGDRKVSSPMAGAFDKKSKQYKQDKEKILAHFALIDMQLEGMEENLAQVADDVIFMPRNQPVMHGKASYKQQMLDSAKYVDVNMKHHLFAHYSYKDIVIARGSAKGYYVMKGQTEQHTFETKNVFIFRRLDNGDLQMWQLIYNWDHG